MERQSTRQSGKEKIREGARSQLCNSRLNPFCDGVKAKLLDERFYERFYELLDQLLGETPLATASACR
jgi:hypothetical protein